MEDLKPRPDELEPIETASRDELAALQLKRLRWTLRHAYENVAASRAKFDNAGVRPPTCAALEDLAKFPFSEKSDLRDAYPFGLFAVPREKIVRVHASSGTTGKPTVVGYTAGRHRPLGRSDGALDPRRGGRPGDIAHVAYGYGLFTGGLGAHYGAERLGCTVVPVSGGMTERQVRMIADLKPRIFMSTPSYMLSILDEFRRAGRRSARDLAGGRDFRRRAVDQRDADGDRAGVRHARHRHLRPLARSWGRASPANASRPRTGCTSGRTISIRK